MFILICVILFLIAWTGITYAFIKATNRSALLDVLWVLSGVVLALILLYHSNL